MNKYQHDGAHRETEHITISSSNMPANCFIMSMLIEKHQGVQHVRKELQTVATQQGDLIGKFKKHI